MYQISFTDEIIVDNFAGGGGASTGIELALGRPVDIAINHDENAIAMHKQNHPFTEHFCESVWDVNPEEVCRGRKVALMWLSPDCKHFSKAKGGKPVEKHIRGLAWIALRWAASVKPRVIILENVEEFKTWGRIDKSTGRPDEKHKGETFRSFVNALKHHGYAVEWKELRACDYGAPTSRKRFVLIARCDGKPIVFPKPTYGVGKGLKPYRTAADIIDWTLPCPSIFERSKPLVEATLRRIARGIDKFVVKNKTPFIIQAQFSNNPQDIEKPISTIESVNKHSVAMPSMMPFVQHENFDNIPQSVEKPVSTITTAPHQYDVETKLMPFIEQSFGGNYDGAGATVRQPLPTITAIDHNRFIAPALIQYHSETTEKEVRASAVDELLPVVDTSNRHAVASAFIHKYYAGNYNGAGSAVDAPLDTITVEERHASVMPFMTEFFGTEKDGTSATLPLRTVMARNKSALVECKVIKVTDTQSFGYWNEVRKMLNKYAGYALKDNEVLIFTIDGAEYFIYDIGMRMLTPRELYNAQGFPKDYCIEFDINGKPYSKKEQIARCGNAVCPPMAEAVVRANLPEYATKKPINTMDELEKAMVA